MTVIRAAIHNMQHHIIRAAIHDGLFKSVAVLQRVEATHVEATHVEATHVEATHVEATHDRCSST